MNYRQVVEKMAKGATLTGARPVPGAPIVYELAYSQDGVRRTKEIAKGVVEKAVKERLVLAKFEGSVDQIRFSLR